MDTRNAEPETTATKMRPKQPRTTLNLKRGVRIAVVALLLALVAWLLFSPAPLHTELATVTRGPMTVSIDDQGQVRTHDRYVIAAPVAARLERIELRDGDPVAKGQALAVLYPLPMDARQKAEATARVEAARALAREAQLHAARADTDLQFAISERSRVERLVQAHFVSPQAADKARNTEAASRAEWEAARSRELAAQADVRAAQAAMIAVAAPDNSGRHLLTLTAPVDGYVLKVHEQSERTVAAGTPLVAVGDPTRYEVVADVLSTDAVKVQPGQIMLLEGWGGGRTLRARVRLVEPVAFTKISALGVEEQRVNVIADPVDPLGPLGDGYRIEARIVIWQQDKVTKLPGSSLFRVGNAWHVFVVEAGRAHEREVKIGQRNQDEAQVLSGVQAGVRIVRFPGGTLKDGMRVAASE